MNKRIKKKWLAALRSGEYHQGMCQLVSKDDCFCCLGVLCNISNKGNWEKTLLDEWLFVYGEDYEGGSLPVEMMRDIDFPPDAESELIKMNDCGYSFNQIADWIEENL